MAQRLVTQTDGNPIPSYVPIYDRLYADIVDGVYPAGTQLPGEAALAEKYGVSRNTLRQALTILNEDRMIRKKQGKGTFITYDPSRRSVLGCHVNPVLDCALQAVDEIKMSYNYGPPTEVAQQKLGIRASDIVMASDNLYCSEGLAVGYSFVQIPVRYISAFNIDLNRQGQADELVNRRIFEAAAKARISVKVVAAEENVTGHLSVQPGQPVLYIEDVLFGRESAGLARCKFYLNPAFYDVEFVL